MYFFQDKITLTKMILINLCYYAIAKFDGKSEFYK